jgi:large subunit ribosomal protein L13e
MKHNNAIPRAHFRKEWERRVKTWFNQPGRKQRRRENRVAKAARVFPRPTSALRPVVQAPTKKYNTIARLGRGFTIEELKAAGITAKYARTIGIATDKRRKNRSEESLQRNVARLKEYVGKLVLFPVKAKKPTKRDSDAAAIKAATQFKGDVNRIATPVAPIVFRAINAAETKASVFARLRRERTFSKVLGSLPKYKARLAEKAKLKKEKEEKAASK